jgi:hypothetical protein
LVYLNQLFRQKHMFYSIERDKIKLFLCYNYYFTYLYIIWK